MAACPEARPRLIFDGDCTFCRRWVARWQSFTGDSVEYMAYQDIASQFPPTDVEQFRRAVHFVEPGGATYRGADAVFRLLRPVPGRGRLHGLYRRLSG